MGVILSAPLLALPALTTVGSWIAGCCGAAACNMLCMGCGKLSSSVSTRICYAILFAVNSILSWVMLTDWAIKKLEKYLSFGYLTFSCFGEECTGFVAVHRINFALAIFHCILGLLLIGVKSSRDRRATIQNGFWGPKIIIWLGLIVVTFLIPEKFFLIWGSYIALVFAFLFVLFGLVLLVDFAHTWAETCILNIENEENVRLWQIVLVGSTSAMYIGVLILVILMYVFFAGSGCAMNQAAITIDLIFTIIVTYLSINPTIQEYNSNAGLSQAAMVCIYCAYLTMSAVASEPDDKNCNPLIRSRGTRTASIVLGALFTIATIAYTTTSAATRSSSLKNRSAANGYASLSDQESAPVSQHNLVTRQPSSRAQMRREAVRQAVERGSLPASALDDPIWDSDEEQEEPEVVSGGDDEKAATTYNYTVFHFIFLLATQWTATLLTMNVEQDPEGDFIPVGRTYFYSWVKIVSAWICFGLYVWTLVAPMVFPDRF